MKRNGSKVITPKKKLKRTEVESDEEEERLSQSESEPAKQSDDDADENVTDQSAEEPETDEEEDSEQDPDEEENAEESGSEQQEIDEEQNDEIEQESEQNDSGDEVDAENRTPSRKQTVVRGQVHRVTPLLKKKKKKAGVIYISSIPKHMNVTILRTMLEPFGEIGRIFLQAAQKDGKVKMKTAQGKRAVVQYTEGWVEFVDKKVAKAIVPLLNMRPITNKKKSVFRDTLWSMKYLSGFQWVHLNERLAYERAVAKEKMREQIQQIRKEVSYHETKVHHKEIALKNAARERKENRARNGV